MAEEDRGQERDVPPELRLVESFLNSVDVETGADDFVDMGNFRRWLREHGQTEAAKSATGRDLARARRFRTVLRECFLADGDVEEARATAEVNTFLEGVPMRASFETGHGLTLQQSGSGVRAVLSQIVADIAVASERGDWQRLKICPADDCLVVYYDYSKNGSRRWCSMETCGNRAKTRSYYRRHSGHAD